MRISQSQSTRIQDFLNTSVDLILNDDRQRFYGEFPRQVDLETLSGVMFELAYKKELKDGGTKEAFFHAATSLMDELSEFVERNEAGRIGVKQKEGVLALISSFKNHIYWLYELRNRK